MIYWFLVHSLGLNYMQILHVSPKHWPGEKIMIGAIPTSQQDWLDTT